MSELSAPFYQLTSTAAQCSSPSRSVAPLVAVEHSITRMAVATEAEAAKQQGDNRTRGCKHTVPYGITLLRKVG